MTIPESVREALFNLKSIEDVEVARDAVLVHKWRETVCEWAVENLPEWTIEALSDSDDDKPVTEEWLKEIGWEHMLLTDPNLWCHRTTPQITIRFLYGKPRLRFGPTATEWNEVSASATRGQVRHLVLALKGE